MRALGLAALIAIFPARVEAAPNPVIASLLSVGSTLIPVGVGTGLLLTGRGADEGLRFDIGVATIAVGSIVGPTVGQLYGKGGWDTLVSFILRAITGSVMSVGIAFHLRGNEDTQSAGLPLLIVGAIPTVGLAAYDVWAAQDSAKEAKYREGHASLLETSTRRAALATCNPQDVVSAGEGRSLSDVLSFATLGPPVRRKPKPADLY